MGSFPAVLLSAAVALSPVVLFAQSPPPTSRWSMEATIDAAFPTSELGDAELETGFGFGANVRYRLQPHLLAYGGWEWQKFASSQLVPSQTVDAEQTGYTLGLRFEHPFRSYVVQSSGNPGGGYWLRAGALLSHIEVEDEDGELIGDTKHGAGWEVGGGLTFPLGNRLAVAPGLRYRSLNRTLEFGSTSRSVTLQYVTGTVGLTIAF